MNKPEEDPKTPNQSQRTKHQLTYMLHVPPTYISYTRKYPTSKKNMRRLNEATFTLISLFLPLESENVNS
jgi:hypothetical protein